MCSEKNISVANSFICNLHSVVQFFSKTHFTHESNDTVTATQQSVPAENCLSLITTQTVFSLFVHLTFQMFRYADRSVFSKHQMNVMLSDFTFENGVTISHCAKDNIMLRSCTRSSRLFTAYITHTHVFCLSYFQTVSTASELRKPIYWIVAAKAIDYEQMLLMMAGVKWDIREIMSQHNVYVDVLLKVILL